MADDKLVQEQLQKYKFDFEAADKDNSGFLSQKEVLDVLRLGGFAGPDEEGVKIFGQYDKNKDCKVSKDEFLNAMKQLPKLTLKEYALRKIFMSIDKDGSERLTKEELQKALADPKLRISESKVKEFIAGLQTDKDGKVDYEEFIRAFGLDSTAAVMGQIFNNLDTDNTGFLTKSEVMAAVGNEKELRLKAEKISDMLNGLAKDSDSKLSYREFLDIWLKEKK